MLRAHASALSLVAALVVLVFTNPVRASLHPLDLPAVPADSARFSAADNPIQHSLAERMAVIAPDEPEETAAPTLDLPETTSPTDIPLLLVGYRAPLLKLRRYQSLEVRPARDLRDEWSFMRDATTEPGTLERLGKMFDVEEDERPWTTVTTVHVLAPTKGWLVPFATIAHEADVNDDLSRLGIGAGAMVILGKHASIGAEVVHFGSGGGGVANDSFSKETRFIARLQLDF